MFDALPPHRPRRRRNLHCRRSRGKCCGQRGCPRGFIVPTFGQACRLLWLVRVLRWKQTHAAIEVGVSSGTASRIVRGERYPNARPIPFVPRRRPGGCGHPDQGVLPL